jgi:hypothetical protein
MIDFTPLTRVRSVLLPYMPDIVGAFRFSLMVNDQNHNYYRSNISNKTLFSGIDDIAYSRTREIFSDVPDISVGKDKGQDYINVGGEIALRVKHFDRNLRARNTQTTHNRQWTNGGRMPGVGNAERADFGYRMDPLGIEFQDAFVALRLHDNLLWLWQVLGDEIDEPYAQLTLSPGSGSEPKFAYDYFGA